MAETMPSDASGEKRRGTQSVAKVERLHAAAMWSAVRRSSHDRLGLRMMGRSWSHSVG